MAEEKKGKEQSKTVDLALGKADWVKGNFDPSIDGVPVLTQDHQPVPADKEDAVRASARVHGFSIRKDG